MYTKMYCMYMCTCTIIVILSLTYMYLREHVHVHAASMGHTGSDLDVYHLREVVESVKDVTKLDPHKLFVKLFKATLNFRLKEDVFSRVSGTVQGGCTCISQVVHVP